VDELRSTPSAGALYPLEIYVFVGEDGVDGVAPGIYHYETTNHSLKRIRDVDCLGELRNAAMDQEAIGMAAVCIVISAVFGRTTRKYGQRGIQYVHQEAGASAQNVYLQATALGLGTVAMGAFTQEDVDDIIGLGRDETPLCILPIGIPVPE
jgi:SagB-type dehydrogenase family enzyme